MHAQLQPNTPHTVTPSCPYGRSADLNGPVCSFETISACQGLARPCVHAIETSSFRFVCSQPAPTRHTLPSFELCYRSSSKPNTLTSHPSRPKSTGTLLSPPFQTSSALSTRSSALTSEASTLLATSSLEVLILSISRPVKRESYGPSEAQLLERSRWPNGLSSERS